MKKVTWIPEAEAAKMANYTRDVFRRYCKSGKLAINFTSINNRNFQYCKEDIEKILLEHSSILS